MFLWVGLGNPGVKYEKTRHNIGAVVLKQITHSCEYKFDKILNSFVSKGMVQEEKCVYLIPQTFMNLSGDAVSKALRTYQIIPENIVIFHDEIELPPAKIHYKFGGGHRGHNGLRDIIKKIGTPDFHRICIGVGRPEHENISVADYVLSDLPKSDAPLISEVETLLKEKKLL